ncbi:NAD(P)-dependent dehydrogenase, short-chain alcohol dehydrogenase family [Sphingomonas laterariae]|uniref:NAD(P)-dependent dehydrogenase, short-chain alcohol dehydrogenase family n=1 Tax=Edaphosphingomonas laterariae TaxID=861865 RepID=A0A239GAZ8_9SPHN|nr:NAD(P)-dependent dehydrogenase, short-chain alcohol dehydrogenase family [Sphingomonas laterariae]
MDHRTAIVTGGGSGIGRAAAIAFAKAGTHVVLADVNRVAGEETAHLIEAAGARAIFTPCDITAADQVEAMVAAGVAAFGRIDHAFNNAGIAPPGRPIADMDEADWDRMIAVNLKGVWLCMKYECRQMLAQGGGAIVNTSSTMGVVSAPGLSAYSASKFGVVGLTKAVAMDYAAQGIRVNAICPGGIGGTAITDDPVHQSHMAQLTQATPMGRLGAPREIADAVVWLCSEGASYMTGQAITIDGGFTVW